MFWSSKPTAPAPVQAPASARRWRRERGADGAPVLLAERVLVESYQGLAHDGIVVELGVAALLLRNGQLVERCGPGFHKLRSEGSADTGTGARSDWQEVEVLFIEAGDIDVEMSFRKGLTSSDDFPIEAQIAVPVRISDPLLCYRNLMGGQDTLTLTALKRPLFPLVLAALGEALGGLKAAELKPNRKRDDSIEGLIRRQLTPTLERLGLELGPMRALSFGGEALDRIGAELGAVAEQRHQQEVEALRREMASRLRAELGRQSVEQAEGEEDLRKALDLVDRGRLLRESEREELVRQLRYEREDAERERRDGLRRAEHAEALRLADEESERRRKAEAEALSRQGHDQAKAARERAEALRAAESSNSLAELERARRKAEAAAELQQDDAEVRAALEWRRLSAEQSLADDSARQALAEAGRQAEHQRGMDVVGAERSHELARMKLAETVSPEALLALQGGESSAALVELRRLAVYKDMSEGQLQAVLAAGSAEYSRALAEGRRRDESQVQEALKQAMESQRQAYERAIGVAESLGRAALERPAAATHVSLPAPPHAHSPSPGPSIYCSSCGHGNPMAARFCMACGQALARSL